MYAATRGYMDDVPVDQVRAFEQAFLDFVRTSHADILTDLATKKTIDDAVEARLKEVIAAFKATFQA